jgi:hypothetical protein
MPHTESAGAAAHARWRHAAHPKARRRNAYGRLLHSRRRDAAGAVDLAAGPAAPGRRRFRGARHRVLRGPPGSRPGGDRVDPGVRRVRRGRVVRRRHRRPPSALDPARGRPHVERGAGDRDRHGRRRGQPRPVGRPDRRGRPLLGSMPSPGCPFARALRLSAALPGRHSPGGAATARGGRALTPWGGR